MNAMTVRTKSQRLSHLMTTGAAAVTITVMLQGCLLGRLEAAHQQACAWEDAVHVTAGGRPGITFNEPLFLMSDVETMVGAPPTMERQIGDRWSWTYVVEKVEGPVASPMRYVTELTFRDHDGAPRLERLELPTEAGPFLTEQALGDLFGEVCALDWTALVLSRDLRRTLSPQQLSLLPDREDLELLLGAPTAHGDRGNSARFEYRLLGKTESTEFGALTVWYAPDSHRPVRFEGHSERVVARANLRSGELVMEITP